MVDEQFFKTSKIKNLVKTIRGGDLTVVDVAKALIIIIVLGRLVITENYMLQNQDIVWRQRIQQQQLQGVYHRHQPGFRQAFLRYRSVLEASKDEGEFIKLTRAQQREQPHEYDIIIIDNNSKLRVGFNQAKYKVRAHGAIHGLPYSENKNGGTVTIRSEENTLQMMDSIVNISEQDTTQWFRDGTYQGGTERGFEAVHMYDPNTRIIVVFKKSTGNFVTTCQLTKQEVSYLKQTGNFGGKTEWVKGQAKNLPPQQTGVNTFESDVMGITPNPDNNL